MVQPHNHLLTHINLVRQEMLFSLFNILRTETPVRVHSYMRFVAGFGTVTGVVFCKAHSEVFFPNLEIRVLTSLWDYATGNSSSFGLRLFFLS